MPARSGRYYSVATARSLLSHRYRRLIETLRWPEPRSAYVHVPFCRHRCGYCNFSVIADRDDLIDRFLNAIDQELAMIAGTGSAHVKGSTQETAPIIDTLFVGGGTPTHLPLRSLERFLTTLRERFRLADGFEWAVEANPEDITVAKLEMLARFGVNRISLGIQSFQDAKLAILERSHSGRSAVAVVEQVAAVISNVSIDLIFAAPGETLGEWQRDLRMAAELPIRHVSTYALTFEKGTSFWARRHRGDLSNADEQLELAMYDGARQTLGEAGFGHYEISNFAQPGFRCRHNLAYWSGDGWYAAGPGAAAYVNGSRLVNHRSTTAYLKRIEQGESPIVESESITVEQAAREFAAFGVRLIDGIDLAAFRLRSGLCIESLCARELHRLESQGLIRRANSHVRLTPKGIHFADTVAAELLG